MPIWLKTTLLTAIAFMAASCSNDKNEEENFDPQPGGKCCEKQSNT